MIIPTTAPQYNIPQPMSTPAQYFDSTQQTIMLIRRIQLGLGTLILCCICGLILKSRLYLYNTTKLFFFTSLLYMLGMLVVLLMQGETLVSADRFVYMDEGDSQQGNYVLNVLARMTMTQRLGCGAEAWLNLLAYDVGYFFAVLVTYNVYCVITGNYRNFMKRIMCSPIILIMLATITIVYCIPLVMLLTVTDFWSGQFYYSYCPTGFSLEYKDQWANLILYCSTCSLPGNTSAQVLSLINVYLCPVVMFFAHTYYLISNQRHIKALLQQQYLNSKQQFIINSGKISGGVFLIQFLHILKLAVGFVPKLVWVTVGLNFLFDMYPLLLLWFYLRYTRQRTRHDQQKQSLLQE